MALSRFFSAFMVNFSILVAICSSIFQSVYIIYGISPVIEYEKPVVWIRLLGAKWNINVKDRLVKVDRGRGKEMTNDRNTGQGLGKVPGMG